MSETALNMIPLEAAAPFLAQLKELYADMDRAYAAVAAVYGFDCRGCRDNCCLTRFYHHTVIEYLYVVKGWSGLPVEQQAAAARQAVTVEAQARAAAENGPVRIMCPLNGDGLCRLYAFRPMICRLHGIPHEFQPPGRPRQYGPGCAAFTRCRGQTPYARFDRTPFYARMARLEKELRTTLGISGRFKMTVAQMINRLQE